MSISQQEIEEKFINDIEKDNVENFKKYIDNVFHINSILRSRHKIWETNHLSILAIACYAGAENIVRYLIEHNVDLNQKDCSALRRSALHWAVAAKNFKIVKMLIDANVEINVFDRYSITPLILSAYQGDVNILKYLIKNGADVNIRDRMNLSALDHACQRLNTEPIRELIICGCKCSSSTPFGLQSPLKTLISNKEFVLARMLIESGLDLKNEKWLLSELKNSENMNNSFFKWLQNNLKTPSSLLSLSRVRMRDLLSSNNLELSVNSLKIPTILKDHLLMKYY